MLEFNYKKTALLSEKKIKKTAEKLTVYNEKINQVAKKLDYQEDESSVQLIFDQHNLDNVLQLSEKYSTDKLKYVVVIGIGGSNLGAMVVYQALYGQSDWLKEDRQPKMLFLDTVLAKNLQLVCDKLKASESSKEFVIIAISKSGGTAETIANLEVLNAKLKIKFDNLAERMIFITDKGSKLYEKAEEKQVDKLIVPKMVGGRFSVFSAVGLLPLALAGINVEKLIVGARQAITEQQNDWQNNKPLQSAVLNFLHYKQGKNIHNSFFFHPDLEMMGKWYRQLVGESLGKKFGSSGKKIRAGITPIVSVGTVDLHSMAQLYFGGPRDKFTNLIYCADNVDIKISEDLEFNLVKDLAGKSFKQILQAIIGGVESAYQENKMPYAVIKFARLNEEAIGYYLQFRMLEIMYLAYLMNVNAFDQPNVEDYKKVTRNLLGS